jgi:tryptophan synthase beta subunit
VQVQTPLERADKLSDALGSDLLLKREDLQPVSSCSSWVQLLLIDTSSAAGAA